MALTIFSVINGFSCSISDDVQSSMPLFCPTFLMDAMSVCREFIVLLARTVHVMLINVA